MTLVTLDLVETLVALVTLDLAGSTRTPGRSAWQEGRRHIFIYISKKKWAYIKCIHMCMHMCTDTSIHLPHTCSKCTATTMLVHGHTHVSTRAHSAVYTNLVEMYVEEEGGINNHQHQHAVFEARMVNQELQPLTQATPETETPLDRQVYGHVHTHVRTHVCEHVLMVEMCTEMCIDMSILLTAHFDPGVCRDMCVDMSILMCLKGSRRGWSRSSATDAGHS